MRALGAAIVALALVAPLTALAQDKKDEEKSQKLNTEQQALVSNARDYIQTMGDRAYAVLRDTPLGSKQRNEEMAVLLLDAMDFPAIARFTLGRRGRSAKGDTFVEYTRLFAAHFIDVANERISNTKPLGFNITSAKHLPNDDVVVNTAIQFEAEEAFEAGWRVRNHKNRGYKIVDVYVQGASAAMHFRNQFSDWLGKAGMTGMMQKLRGMTKESPNLVHVANYKVE